MHKNKDRALLALSSKNQKLKKKQKIKPLLKFPSCLFFFKENQKIASASWQALAQLSSKLYLLEEI